MPESLSLFICRIRGGVNWVKNILLFLSFFACLSSSVVLYAETSVSSHLESYRKTGRILLPPPENFFVRDCLPCRIRLTVAGEHLAVNFRFDLLENGSRQLSSLMLKSALNKSDKPALQQILPSVNSSPIANNEAVFLGAADINRDGYNDLYLITARKHRVRFADYWLYRSDKSEFEYLGNYPLFKIDAHKGDLITRHQPDTDRHSYEENRYHFVDARLKLFEQVKVLPTAITGRYKKVRSKLLADEMKQVSVEWLRF